MYDKWHFRLNGQTINAVLINQEIIENRQQLTIDHYHDELIKQSLWAT